MGNIGSYVDITSVWQGQQALFFTVDVRLRFLAGTRNFASGRDFRDRNHCGFIFTSWPPRWKESQAVHAGRRIDKCCGLLFRTWLRSFPNGMRLWEYELPSADQRSTDTVS